MTTEIYKQRLLVEVCRGDTNTGWGDRASGCCEGVSGKSETLTLQRYKASVARRVCRERYRASVARRGCVEEVRHSTLARDIEPLLLGGKECVEVRVTYSTLVQRYRGSVARRVCRGARDTNTTEIWFPPQARRVSRSETLTLQRYSAVSLGGCVEVRAH
ncbi:hypothetical protein RRG08_061420 [Elysia crispata]|uniref:Uncharacterized protein n=1 Tax=Elysia crispata TaxID=231223 RepID=A0AAE1DKA0_9GAST|nr:hypothetical protein RRG08_061420 [Elysia crispata]